MCPCLCLCVHVYVCKSGRLCLPVFSACLGEVGWTEGGAFQSKIGLICCMGGGPVNNNHEDITAEHAMAKKTKEMQVQSRGTQTVTAVVDPRISCSFRVHPFYEAWGINSVTSGLLG